MAKELKKNLDGIQVMVKVDCSGKVVKKKGPNIHSKNKRHLHLTPQPIREMPL